MQVRLQNLQQHLRFRRQLDVPAAYILLDHAISRAIDKGAVEILEVTGLDAPQIFKPLKAGAADAGH